MRSRRARAVPCVGGDGRVGTEQTELHGGSHTAAAGNNCFVGRVSLALSGARIVAGMPRFRLFVFCSRHCLAIGEITAPTVATFQPRLDHISLLLLST